MEIDPDIANKLFEDMTDEEVADVIPGTCEADDAADAVADLEQKAPGQSSRAFCPSRASGPRWSRCSSPNAASAGGIATGVDFLAVPARRHGRGGPPSPPAGRRRAARSLTDRPRMRLENAGLAGTVTVIDLLHAELETPRSDLMDE